MKKQILITILFFVVFTAKSQESFTVDYNMTVIVGRERPLDYQEMKTPIKVFFDDKKLTMVYTSGKPYLDWEIDEIKKKPSENGDLYILRVEEEGFIQYVLIKKDSLGFEIRLPSMVDGFIIGYDYFVGDN
jgi:hypothetical protein